MRTGANTNLKIIFALIFWEKLKKEYLNKGRTFGKEIKAYLNDKKW